MFVGILGLCPVNKSFCYYWWVNRGKMHALKLGRSMLRILQDLGKILTSCFEIYVKNLTRSQL